ncbi:MAG TPA: tetratricopeptide repeat protein [Candidatus Wallbacteria bacterium]|nr:tetratricopeptide repeat protein [Candidatus Wallbacteria bacterium]
MKKKIDDYLVDISSDDEKTRLNAVIELGDIDDETAINILTRLKVDPSSAVRFYAKKSILKLTTKFQKTEAEIPASELSEEIKDKILKIKNIEKIKDRSKIDKLFADMAAETSPLVKSIIVSVLGKLCDEKHVDRILELTTDADTRMVANAVEALENIGSEKAIEPLTLLLFHEDSRVKANVCKALWKFSDKKKDIGLMVMSRMRELVASEKPWIRSSAIYVLSEIKTAEAIELIKNCKNDAEKIIKDQAADTLKKMGVVEAPPPISEDQKEKMSLLEELPPDDFIPKAKFYGAKLLKFLKEKFTLLQETLDDEDKRQNIKNYLKKAAIMSVILFFFVVVFNAIWELKYPQPIIKEDKKIAIENEMVSRNVLEAASQLKKLNLDDSILKLKKELEKNQDDPIAKKLLAVAYNQKALKSMDSSNPKEAAELANEAVKLSPDFTEAYLTLARAQTALNDTAKALETLKNGIAQNDKNASIQQEYGKLLISKGNFEEARTALQNSIDNDTANGVSYYLMTKCLLALKETDAAKNYYAKAIFFEPQKYELRRETAEKFIELNFFSEAITELSIITKNSPKNIKARETLGNLYFQTSNYRGAAEEFKAALAESPNNYEVTFKAGLCYQAMENVDEMFRYFYKAVKLNPNFAEAYQALGGVYEFQKNLAAAKTCYDRVIKLNPGFIGSYISLAQMHMNANQFPNAVSTLTSALKNIPDNREILFTLAMAYIGQKDNKNAKDTFNRLLTLIGDEKDDSSYKKITEIISKL